MINLIKSEWMKQKGTFNKKIIIVMPIVALFVAYLLMGIADITMVQEYSYYMWYLLILPFVVTWIGASLVNSEKKYNFHGLFGIIQDKTKIWYSKIIVGILILASACGVFSLVTLVSGNVLGEFIPASANIVGIILLIITFAWQIPLSMFICLKTNMFVAVLINMVGSMVVSVACPLKSIWLIPYSIPTRIMCPIVKIHPNGIPLEANSIYLNSNVVVPGVIVAVLTFVIVTVITAKSFSKQEV